MAHESRSTSRPRPGKPGRRITQLRLPQEIRYIQRRASAHQGRIVAVGPLVLFSAETGDAWLLDPDDGFAARVARDGAPEPVDIKETDTAFAVDWPGNYLIEGPAFIYIDRGTGRATTIIGYPTQQLKAAGKS